MEDAFKELSSRDDLVQILALVIAVIIGMIVFWVMRILFEMVKNMGSGSDKSMTVIKELALNNRELAVNNTANQQRIAGQLTQSSQSLNELGSIVKSLRDQQTEQQQVMASITVVLDQLQKTTAQADIALRAEIDQHETKAIERSNENLEVAQKILLEVSAIPRRLNDLETRTAQIVATIGTMENKHKTSADHLKRIEKSVLDAIKGDSNNRTAMIKRVLDTLSTIMDSLKALQDKPAEVVAVFQAGNADGESA